MGKLTISMENHHVSWKTRDFYGHFPEEKMLSTLCSEATVSLPRLTPMERAKAASHKVA